MINREGQIWFFLWAPNFLLLSKFRECVSTGAAGAQTRKSLGHHLLHLLILRLLASILEKLKNCQNGTFEPVHEIWNFFWPKVFFWSIMKVPFRKNIHNMPQGPPNPGFMQEKVQKGDFLKKPSRELKFFCCFRFLWISRWPGMLNWKQLPSFFCCLKSYTRSVLCTMVHITKYSCN